MGAPDRVAGLVEFWTQPDGAELLTFTSVTTGADEIMVPMHDCMWVILDDRGVVLIQSRSPSPDTD